METQPNATAVDDASFMQLAMAQARLAAAAGEVPVGAVLVRDNTVLVATHNHVERDGDPTAHAEVVAIRAATKALGNKFLGDCDLYVTLEPCAMCAGAIAMARVRRVVFAATDPKGGAVVSGGKFFTQPTCHHHPIIAVVDDYAADSAALLKDFFKARR
jgi:tRNA(adenine34) deaminase